LIQEEKNEAGSHQPELGPQGSKPRALLYRQENALEKTVRCMSHFLSQQCFFPYSDPKHDQQEEMDIGGEEFSGSLRYP
jgi:hypothetical protein